MKSLAKFSFSILILVAGTLLCSSFLKDNASLLKFSFPYKNAGLNERQAAAHLLNRFSYGAREGDIDRVVDMGLERWFQQQLDAGLPDDTLNSMLNSFNTINMTNIEISNTFPKKGQLLRMALKDGTINKDSIAKTDKKEYQAQLASYGRAMGMRPEQELFRQFISQKILRAAYTNNQLQEILTDFWFNHFNVSLTKNQCASFVPAYERDVIRPNVTGKFENLLLATAKSPAMLMYLDNSNSTSTDNDHIGVNGKLKQPPPKRKSKNGLNENYAREVMELHTLGVDGGYTQNDVTQAAGVFTGWTLYPMGRYGYDNEIKTQLDKIGESKLEERGFVHDGDFLFVPTRHDNSDKVIMGLKLNGSDGYNEGLRLFHMLAHHPSTAKFISRKLAVRFVSDQPKQSLLDKMALTFKESDGNIKKVLITMVSAPEFWTPDALREKTKSPFELAISAVRSLDADIRRPYELFSWLTKMGQKMYYYQDPTGFPDRGQYWINTGSLLSRMNFGLALANQRIPGVEVNLAALNNNHEPESPDAALLTYGKIILPEQNLDQTVKRLQPLLKDPNLQEKVSKAAAKGVSKKEINPSIEMGPVMPAGPEVKTSKVKIAKPATFNNVMLAQVVGVIIGSPEFQRK